MPSWPYRWHLPKQWQLFKKFRYTNILMKEISISYSLPVPCMNVINGGRHADNNVDFQGIYDRSSSCSVF
ncbi:hypothetical protein ACQ86N_02320 [Puia sp. P3]|uniref:hypothetical protein n=1 Tax=Puia sp. P3 TaxID=3423952 RepID=UPI003D67A6BA